MTDLARRVEILNGLTRRKLELEAALRMVTWDTRSSVIRLAKRELARVNARIKTLEGKLR
jgi:hypothetical protein